MEKRGRVGRRGVFEEDYVSRAVADILTRCEEDGTMTLRSGMHALGGKGD